MKEEWREIPSYPAYEASSLGRIRRAGTSMGTYAGRIRAVKKERTGYMRVNLSIAGKVFYCMVHRLVTEAFYGAPNPGDHAAHLNGVRDDNKAKNLCWASAEENERHKDAHGTVLCGERVHSAKLTEQDVRDILAVLPEKRGQQATLARQYNVSISTIRRVWDRKTWRRVSAIGSQQAGFEIVERPMARR